MSLRTQTGKKRSVAMTTGEKGKPLARQMREIKSIGRCSGRTPRDHSALTEKQKAVLAVVTETGIPAYEVGKALGMPPQSARSVLLALSKKGHVHRDPNTALWRRA
jgi:DNA-binding MarR family transcriptional regulator